MKLNSPRERKADTAHVKMETRSKNCLGKKPLPGERQGMSGADAGHDSMRDVGGRVLRRRAPVAEEATAPNNHLEAPHIQRTEDLNVPQPIGSPTARRAASRRERTTRIRWTREMNIQVMRAYYYVNKCAEEPLPGWRSALHNEYVKRFPDIQVSEQNIADRKNVIIKKKYLTEVELDNIKREVGYELQQQDAYAENSQADEMADPINAEQNNASQRPENNTEPGINAVVEKFQSLLAFYAVTDPLKRPKIPKLRNIPRAKTTISDVNIALRTQLAETTDIADVHLALYCAAVTVIEISGQKTYMPRTERRLQKEETPAWKKRLENDINEYRGKADILSEYLAGNQSSKVTRKVRQIVGKCGISFDSPNLAEELLDLKDRYRQKAKAKGARLARYNELEKRKHQNSIFQSDQKRFYRELESESTDPQQELTEDKRNAFADYWKSIWVGDEGYNKSAEWITSLERQTQNLPYMSIDRFTATEVKNAVNRTQNWKAPGPDGIHNFWMKQFTAAHEALARAYTKTLYNPQSFPHFLAEGNTFLLYKKGDASQPNNYRPITCLSVVYKLFTAMLNEKIYLHCSENNIFEEEQKGCIRASLGCKEQLTIDAVLLKQVEKMRRNLNVCYVDYRKAFDSVPHDWLIKVLQIYKVCPRIVNALQHIMGKWKSNLYASNQYIGPVNIEKGIFQGDSLSPVWFCLALNPMSTLLNNSEAGYRLNMRNKRRLSHLLYMDDLKLYGESQDKLHSLIKTVEVFSKDIKMSFGLDKCAIINIKKGVVENGQTSFCNIQQLAPEESYRYLGAPQNQKYDHTKLKQDFTDKYRRRLTKLMNTKLNGGNLIKAINGWAVPALTYSFGIVKWSITDLDELDRLTRRILTKFRYLHPSSSTNRLYMPRKQGGRGLINIKNLCLNQENRMRERLRASESQIMKLIVREDKGFTPLNLSHRNITVNATTTRDRGTSWSQQVLHGRYPKSLEEDNTDKLLSLKWLTDGLLYPETEGFISAIQDRVVRTKNYEKHVLKLDVTDRCRKCGAVGETIEHIIAGCPTLAPNAYLGRHNQVAKIIHQQIALKYQLLDAAPPPYYKYLPAPVLESTDVVLYWDRQIITDRTVDHNRPDIVLIKKNEREADIIDIAVPLSHNIVKTEREKVINYENLAYDLKAQWNLRKVEIVPLVISAEGILSKNFTPNINNLGLPKSIATVGQRAVLLQTCHIVRKVLS